MKVCVSSYEPTLDSRLQPSFGRCAYFIFVDPETLEFEVASNPNLKFTGGAGILNAQFVITRGVGAVITGRVGPNAKRILNAVNVEVIGVVGGTVREAVEAFKDRQTIQTAGAVSRPEGQRPARGSEYGSSTGEGGKQGSELSPAADLAPCEVPEDIPIDSIEGCGLEVLREVRQRLKKDLKTVELRIRELEQKQGK